MSEHKKMMFSKIKFINKYKNVIKDHMSDKVEYCNQSVSLIYILTNMLLENKKISEYQDISLLLSELQGSEFVYMNEAGLSDILSTIRSFLYKYAPTESADLKKIDKYYTVLPYFSKPKQYRKKIG